MATRGTTEEVAEASRKLSGTKVSIFAVLESQMGDPVLSHWIGNDGVVAGTALGRVSAYLFDLPDPYLSGVNEFSLQKSATAQNGQQNDGDDPSPLQPADSSHADVNSLSEEVEKEENIPTKKSREDVGLKEVYKDDVNNAVIIAVSDDIDTKGIDEANNLNNYEGTLRRFASLCSTLMGYIRCDGRPQKRVSIDEVFPGRYTVFASFSEEAVRAVFIHNRLLYCMIGTSAIAVYDVDQYTLKNEYRLSLSRNVGYKQISFSNCKILVDCIRGSTILDPVEKKQISSTHRVYPSNVLDFNGAEMLCYYRNINKYFVQVVSLEVDATKKVVFSIAVPESVYLVTHGRFWGTDRIVIVCDMLTISIFKYLEMIVPVARRKMRVDIVAVCGGFDNFLVVLSKDSTLKLLHGESLETFFSISVYPATFELGWPYSLMSYKNILSFTSDEGVYCLKIPQKVLQISSTWRKPAGDANDQKEQNKSYNV